MKLPATPSGSACRAHGLGTAVLNHQCHPDLEQLCRCPGVGKWTEGDEASRHAFWLRIYCLAITLLHSPTPSHAWLPQQLSPASGTFAPSQRHRGLCRCPGVGKWTEGDEASRHAFWLRTQRRRGALSRLGLQGDPQEESTACQPLTLPDQQLLKRLPADLRAQVQALQVSQQLSL